MEAEGGKTGRPLPFSWIHAWRENSDLDRGVRLVLFALAQYMDKRGVAWPSYATLARDTGYSVRHVKRLIKTAETMGWLVIETGGGPPGLGGHPNKYRAVFPSGDMDVTTSSGDILGQGGDIGGTEVVTPVSPKEPGKTQQRILTENNADQRFDNTPKRGSYEFFQMIKEAMEEGPEALQGAFADVDGFTASEADWAISFCDEVTRNGGEDAYDLAATALSDMGRKCKPFTRRRLATFMSQLAELHHRGDTDAAYPIRETFISGR